MKRTQWFVAAAVCAAVAGSTAWADTAQLNISSGFNMDAWIGPAQYQYVENLGTRPSALFGADETRGVASQLGNNNWNSAMFAANSTAAQVVGGYSIPADWFYPQYLSGTEGTPVNGVLTSTVDARLYHIASVGGNATLPGDWTEVANLSTNQNKMNCIVIGQHHNAAEWSVFSATATVTPAKYSDINFVLAAGAAHGASGMQIFANYADSTQVLLYDFGTATSFVGPDMTGATASGFTTVYQTSKWFSDGSGSNGNITPNVQARLYEFSTPLALDPTKVLTGISFVDSGGVNQDWYGRELGIFGATATIVPVAGASAWNVAGSGDWTIDANWNPSGAPNSAGAIAELGNKIGSASQVLYANSNVTLGTLNINNPGGGNYMVTGWGKFTFASTGTNAASINVFSGNHVFNPAAIQFSSNTTINLSASTSLILGGTTGGVVVDPGMSVTKTGAGTLSILGSLIVNGTFNAAGEGTPLSAKFALQADSVTVNPGGNLQLGSSGMILHHETVAQAAADVAAGGITGTATVGKGFAIVSGADYIKNFGASVDGHTILASDTVMQYGWNGDSNFDGKITLDDYIAIDAGYRIAHSSCNYFTGDFNNDGVVDAADYVLIDTAALNGGSSLAEGMIALHAAWFGSSYAGDVAALAAPVPEPASLALVGLGAAALLRRRRK